MSRFLNVIAMMVATLICASAAPMDMGAMPMGMVDPGAVTYAIKIFTDLNLTEMYSSMPYTIFAPSDMAFEVLAKSLNATVPELITKPSLVKAAISTLKYNIVPGVALLAAGVTATPMTVPTAAGPTAVITIVEKNGKVLVSPGATIGPMPAMVLKADIKLGMSIVHVTDKVLVPPTA